MERFNLGLHPPPHSVGPDLGPNCLQWLSADGEKLLLARKEVNMYAKLSSGARGLYFGLNPPLISHFACMSSIGIAPIMQLHMCVIKIVTFKRGH